MKRVPILAATLCFAASTAQGMKFSAAACRKPDPQGRIHISVGALVLRVDPKLIDISNITNSSRPELLAPDPKQPVGCYGNPLPHGGVSIDFFLGAWLRNHETISRSPLERFSLSTPRTDYWSQYGNAKYRSFCKISPHRRSLANGLHGCVTKFNPKDPSRAELGIYEADPVRYKLPLSELFYVNCQPNIPEGVICDVRYKLDFTINLYYRFSTKKLPLEKVIDFDKELRKQLEKSLVVNYPWRR